VNILNTFCCKSLSSKKSFRTFEIFFAGSKNLTFLKIDLKNGSKNGKCVLDRVATSIELSKNTSSKTSLMIFLQYSSSVRNFPDSTSSTSNEQSIL